VQVYFPLKKPLVLLPPPWSEPEQVLLLQHPKQVDKGVDQSGIQALYPFTALFELETLLKQHCLSKDKNCI
jgi:hypothetical protein